jgi:phosphoribosylglycinamide formyltransferase-1
MKKIVVLVSGGGTNLQALIDTRDQFKNAEISCVISSNPNAYALERASKNGIKTRIVAHEKGMNREHYSHLLLSALQEESPDLIVLAGFMIVISEDICKTYSNKIINVHPSLIPAFCGEGYYGLHVHEAAIQRGVKITGATVHFVNEICDGGPIILQKAVEVKTGDTPEILQKRVMLEAEQVILPQAVIQLTMDNG